MSGRPIPKSRSSFARKRVGWACLNADISDEEIVERCIFALVNEGARILEEGIASSAADIDVIWANGYGFPRTRGGPMFYGDTIGLQKVLSAVRLYEREQGAQYWTPAPLLTRSRFDEGFIRRLVCRWGMTMKLRSYVCGAWQEGSREGTLLRDATTGAVVAQASSEGIDFGATLDYARRVGGPALRELTFHQRAALVKQLAKFLTDRKAEFYTLSYATGATKSDSWIDIDGGISTLFVFASKGARELPDHRVYVDGSTEMLSKTGNFIGPAHLHAARRRGRAHQRVQLSGVGHAGEARSYADRRRTGDREAGNGDVVPDGAGRSAHRRVGHPAGGRSNSSAEARATCSSISIARMPWLSRGRRARRRRFGGTRTSSQGRFASRRRRIRSIRPCSARTPVPGTPEFDLFVREVVREMTVKAGQKCTAIRKAIVPAEHAGAVVEALRGALSKIVVGDPRLENVRMGPVASLAQQREVREQLAKLEREAQLVHGGASVELAGADAEKGAFIPPTLLLCKDASRAKAVHEVEAFGPVCTVVPYASADDAIAPRAPRWRQSRELGVHG